MATIASVDVGAFAVPENPTRVLVRSVGISQAGTVKIVKFRDADQEFTVTLVHKTASIISTLYAALASAQSGTIAIDPDTPVDLGNGAGTAVNAYWIDRDWKPIKEGHENWTVTMRFRYSS